MMYLAWFVMFLILLIVISLVSTISACSVPLKIITEIKLPCAYFQFFQLLQSSIENAEDVTKRITAEYYKSIHCLANDRDFNAKSPLRVTYTGNHTVYLRFTNSQLRYVQCTTTPCVLIAMESLTFLLSLYPNNAYTFNSITFVLFCSKIYFDFDFDFDFDFVLQDLTYILLLTENI